MVALSGALRIALLVATILTDAAACAEENDGQPEPSGSSPKDTVCEALATAAAANDLPVRFFVRLIWQESRFDPAAISRAGAQGVAQFMPGTAKMRGLEDPFNPTEAIAKSAELLRDLNRDFGNLGLAAAAYNAGPRRVRDWLGGRRSLPNETRAYVNIVTGRPAEEWAAGQKNLVETPVENGVPCGGVVGASIPPSSPSPKIKTVKPWGVELVGGPTPIKALARYHELELKYATILTGQETHIVIRGVIGEMGAARVRSRRRYARRSKQTVLKHARGWLVLRRAAKLIGEKRTRID